MGESMHSSNERVSLNDLKNLTKIYKLILEEYFKWRKKKSSKILPQKHWELPHFALELSNLKKGILEKKLNLVNWKISRF